MIFWTAVIWFTLGYAVSWVRHRRNERHRMELERIIARNAALQFVRHLEHQPSAHYTLIKLGAN